MQATDLPRGLRILRAKVAFYGPLSTVKVEADEERCEGGLVIFSPDVLVVGLEDFLSYERAVYAQLEPA